MGTSGHARLCDSSPAGMLDLKSLNGAVKLASQVALVVKNPPDNTESVRDSGLIPRSQVRSLGWEDLLEEGTAAHSGILAWRIPWTEEPAELPSMTLQIRHG